MEEILDISVYGLSSGILIITAAEDAVTGGFIGAGGVVGGETIGDFDGNSF